MQLLAPDVLNALSSDSKVASHAWSLCPAKDPL